MVYLRGIKSAVAVKIIVQSHRQRNKIFILLRSVEL